MSAPAQSGEGVRPGLPEEKGENRAELGAEKARAAPEAPRGPAPAEARLEDVLGALMDYINMREEMCIRELEAIHKVKREITNYVFARIERRSQRRRGGRRKRGGGVEVQAPQPVDPGDRAVQYLMRQLSAKGVKYALMYNSENKIAAIKFLGFAPRGAVSLARWALRAAAERPRSPSGSQPSQEKRQ